ncbi:MAG: DUF456 domain-containing protein [Candidatus Marinimicrobia bacterium]|nr:DUF456 domain-containing protein [Candidatus Neomarinimicrobiota bacterium]MCF7851319.1 DUF456 domain-containing protein [Candidatus Neomarinimicrobiota bacterium]
MDVLLIILIIIFTVLSSVIIWLNLPGTFVMLLFIFIWAWSTGFTVISATELSIIFVILLFLEFIEYGLSGLAAKYSGAEDRSAFLAIVGGLLGTIVLGSLFFVVGAILGLFLGSYLGAYWGENQAGKTSAEARKAALGALMGSITAKVLKTAVTVVIAVWMIGEVV